MKYRLVCIIDKVSPEKGVEIEVCLETGSKNLSPFQRKVTVSDLVRSEKAISNSLIQLLFQTGQYKQPFSFSFEQLGLPIVKNAISSQKWIYFKSGGRNNSLKKASSLPPYLLLGSNKQFEIGSLIGGELYVSDIRRWWHNVNVRFRYENTALLFPANYTTVPFQTENKGWRIRNQKEENSLLALFGSSLDYDRSVLNLNKEAFDQVKYLIQNGWKLFVPKGQGSHTSVYFKKDKSGIEWFSTDSRTDENNETTERILEAYLHNRNYTESKGDIQLFNRKTIVKLSPEVVSKILVPNFDVEKFYAPIPQLSEEKRAGIYKLIQAKVKAILKPYQVDGLIWLWEMRKKGSGCMLADDMGLGKTLQVLAYLAMMNIRERHLVICPASLTSNWENEMNRFTPQLTPQIDIASYEMVRIHPEKYSNQSYDTIIVDEGQFVKNDNTQRHKVISELPRKHMIMLSGTPIENSIHEIWSQFKLLIPEIEDLQNKLQSMDVQGNDKHWIELSKMFLSPFILRRTKKEVLKNLPKKSEENIFVELSIEERRIYQSIQRIFIEAIESGVSGRINSIALEGLLRLRQCCVSTNLLPKHLTNAGYIKSSKMELAIKLIHNFMEEKHKILVFSQFTTALNELRDNLTKVSVKTLLLSGSTRNRQALVDSFQTDSEEKVFLISLKAGGTGLNLTAADRVILLDDWWNPAVESQAFSRAHRIGQENAVEVYRIVCRNSVEEKILELHKNKKEISDLFNAAGDKLSLEQMKNLLS